MKTYTLLIASFVLLLLPSNALAATMSFRATPTHVGVGDVVRVDILLDSAIPANAFSGSVVYSGAKLEPVAVSDGNSLVSVWVTRPAFTATSTSISFAGLTPGGFSGSAGMLFSVLFRAKTAGAITVDLKDVEVLRNDGAGGVEPTVTRPLSISIVQKSSGGYTELADTVPPEPFSAYLGSDPQLFDGKSYLAFSTADKLSGVDHYAVAESRLPSFLLQFFPLTWVVVTSPYALSNQNLTSTVYLKAVDRAGNERLSVFPPKHLLTSYELVVIVVILVAVVLLWHRRKGRRL